VNSPKSCQFSLYGTREKSMSYNRVLVTGGAGFVGSHLVEGLLKEGFDVTVLDNLSTGSIENLRCLNGVNGRLMRFVKGDVRNRSLVEKALNGVEAVFHLAAVSSVPYSFENPDVTYDVNVVGTRSLLDACLRSGVGRFIYVSTCAVYGEPEYLPIDERHPLKPVSPYAETKLEAERICMDFHGKYGLGTTILRPFNIYGLRMRNDQYGGVIARFIDCLCSGEPPVIYGDGEQTRDFLHVEDAVRGFMLALSSEGAVGRVFNIATGIPTSVDHLAHLLIGLLGVERIVPRHLGAREGDIRHSYAEVREARYRLGFEPRISLKEGLSVLVYRSNLLVEPFVAVEPSSFGQDGKRNG